MKNWTDEFILQVLKKIPAGRYRTRAEKELRDHMETQYQVLTEGKMLPQQAQAEVLRSMGDPARLRKEYHIAWKQTPLCRANWIASGVIVLWFLSYISVELFAWASAPEALASKGLPWSITALFLIPFPLEALFLRACFREERRRVQWITLGLLIAWASINLYLIWGFTAIEQINPGPDLLEQLSRKTPWFVPYLRLSFAGCPVLGWLFGRKTERSYQLT